MELEEAAPGEVPPERTRQAEVRETQEDERSSAEEELESEPSFHESKQDLQESKLSPKRRRSVHAVATQIFGEDEVKTNIG